MIASDQASQALGIVLEDIGPGHARCSMVVRPDMLNGHATLHGGVCFTLADTAFAMACNAGNHRTVAAGCDIVFSAAGRAGDRLTAVAEERHRAGRNGVYDVTVTNQDAQVIALFRGRARQLSGFVLPCEESPADD
jgi:acyl-CoA thioesterase